MEDPRPCPYCGSPRTILREGVVRARIVPDAHGGPGVEREVLVFRCLECGRGFDELEAGEGPDPEGPELFR